MQQYCKNVSTLSTYRQIIAAILLALYVFIATPVEHWHHHAGAVSGTDLTVYPKAKVTSAGKEHCTICAHQYTVYEESIPFHWQSWSLLLGIYHLFLLEGNHFVHHFILLQQRPPGGLTCFTSIHIFLRSFAVTDAGAAIHGRLPQMFDSDATW